MLLLFSVVLNAEECDPETGSGWPPQKLNSSTIAKKLKRKRLNHLL
jgi:hypothetical protein